MRKVYKRKTSWTAEALYAAMSKVTSKELGINQASREYGIPSCTLRRHLTSGITSSSEQTDTEENVWKIIRYIKLDYNMMKRQVD